VVGRKGGGGLTQARRGRCCFLGRGGGRGSRLCRGGSFRRRGCGGRSWWWEKRRGGEWRVGDWGGRWAVGVEMEVVLMFSESGMCHVQIPCVHYVSRSISYKLQHSKSIWSSTLGTLGTWKKTHLAPQVSAACSLFEQLTRYLYGWSYHIILGVY